ncbi:hypothetical protein DLM78_12865 [Leptospira stimsonii]|uniref:Uncharacterized protein n=1 Tax=Leptospira stimsonii TaxID=2202203 RepID=A0A8B3CRT2_9LEPT|nr:hypothetical protein DLM78_12865 [Leptospira stimsonii]
MDLFSTLLDLGSRKESFSRLKKSAAFSILRLTRIYSSRDCRKRFFGFYSKLISGLCLISVKN